MLYSKSSDIVWRIMDRQRSSLFAHQTSYRDRICCIKTPHAMTIHFVFPYLSRG